jgi:sentrin-specific protease 1
LAVIYPKEMKIQHFDSKHWPLFEVLEALEIYLITEAQKKLNLKMVGCTKKLADDFPRQNNDNDCGVFMCVAAEHISRAANIMFDQSEMAEYRLKMIDEIFHGEFIPQNH